MTLSCDVAVIGAGPGGYVAAIRAAQLGFRTVCIDKSRSLGGTCLNVGCIPSKALLQSTEFYDQIQHEAINLGVEYNGLCPNFATMMHRKDSIIKGLTEGIAGLFKKNGVTFIHGTARFISPRQLEVSLGESQQKAHELIEAKYFILATGSEPISLSFLPFDEKVIVSSTGALSLLEIPKRLIVIGGGVIGVELASVYRRLGSEVTIIEMMEMICPAMDKLVSQTLLKSLKRQGLSFMLSSQVISASISPKEAMLVARHDNQEVSLAADVVLVCVGRRPLNQGLGLQNIGIKITPKGFVEVDKAFQTSISHIYAIGDLIDGAMLAHRASEEGIAVAEILAGLHPHLNYMAIPNVIYTSPEVAAVGLTEQEALEAGLQIKMGISYFKGNPRARCMGMTEGFVKIIGEAATDRFIGLHIVGPHASEMIGEGVIAMEKKATLKEIAYASHPHPTLTEAIKEAAFNTCF